MKRQHCIVIGAGTVGSSCAWQLVQRGHQVTLIDRAMPGMSTSFGNAGCISPSHVLPFSHPGVARKIRAWLADELGPLTIRWKHLPWVAPWLWKFWRNGTREKMMASAHAQVQLMQRVSKDFHDTLDRAGLSHYLQSKGLIVVYDSQESFAAERWTHELEQELGFDWEFLGKAELAIMAPALELGKGVALYIPSWEHSLDPGRMTAGIAEAAMQGGALWLHEEVRQVSAGPEGVEVTTSAGQNLKADQLVIAAGPWSNQLAGQLDYTVPMTAKRGYHSMVASPGIELDYPILSGSRSFVITPMNDGLRLAGTAEFARLDAEPNYRRAEILRQHAQYYLPDLQLESVTEWMGQRPMMVDSVAVISRSPRHNNVIYAFGHGHYGLTQGPTTGMMVSDMVDGAEPSLDLSPYRFDRFRNP